MDNQYYNNQDYSNGPVNPNGPVNSNSVTPFTQETNYGNTMSLRTYTFMLSLLVFGGFAVMGVCASLFANPNFLLGVMRSYLVVTIVSFVVSIGSVFVMNMGKKTQSVGVSLVGYLMMTLSLGFTTSLALLYYDLGTISTAFLATAGVVVVFACLGLAFPQFFAKLQGALGIALLGVILVEIVMLFLNVNQTIVDFIVIAIFSGFIARDFYVAVNDTPTMANAVFNASQLYLDILNVFMRIVSILGDRRD